MALSGVMKQRIIAKVKETICWFVLLSCGTVGAEAPNMTVKAAGVTLDGVKSDWTSKQDKEILGNLTIVGDRAPVVLSLMIKGSDKTILDYDGEASEISSLIDDRKTNLRGKMDLVPRIAEDGSAALAFLEGKKSVSPRAEALMAKGNLKFTVASKRAATRSKVVEAKSGSVLTIDNRTAFTVMGVEIVKPEQGFDVGPFKVTLRIGREIPEVAQIRFYDGKGELIESKRRLKREWGSTGKMTVSLDYSLARQAEKISIEVDRWTDMEEVTVPFDVKVGIGGKK